MRLDLKRTALVVIDPQIDFMSPKGKSWSIVGESVTEQKLVPN
jgi:nicotinamidase-related amidase